MNSQLPSILRALGWAGAEPHEQQAQLWARQGHTRANTPGPCVLFCSQGRDCVPPVSCDCAGHGSGKNKAPSCSTPGA